MPRYPASAPRGYPMADQLSFFTARPRLSDVEKHEHGGYPRAMWGREELSKGWLAAFGTGGYVGEAPLLEELGVNFGHVKVKTLTALNPFAAVDYDMMHDSDIAGPILYYLLFGVCLLPSGNSHFSYIYTAAVLGSVSIHILLKLMSQPFLPHTPCPLSLLASSSVLGYCLLPLVFTSLLGIALPMNSAFGCYVNSLAVAWCTYSASGILTAVMRITDLRLLMAYPLALFYSLFGIIVMFGSGDIRMR